MSDEGNQAENSRVDKIIADLKSVADEASAEITAVKQTALTEIGEVKSTVEDVKARVKSALADIEKAKTTIEESGAAATNEIERSRSGVRSAKTITDAAINEIDRNKVAAAESRGAIQENQKSTAADAASIHQAMAEVQELRAKAVAEANGLAAKQAAVSQKIIEVQDRSSTLDEILTVIARARDDSETKRASVEADVAKIAEARDNFSTLNGQAQQQHDDLAARKTQLDTQIAEIETIYTRVTDVRGALFDETDGKKSFNKEVDELRAKVALSLAETESHIANAQAFFDRFKLEADEEKNSLIGDALTQFGNLRASLEAEIRALLPSAGAAGLASTYYDAKSRYAPTSFAGKPGADALSSGALNWWRRKFGYNPASVVATIFFYAMFILPILTIVYIFYDLIKALPGEKLIALDIRIVTLRILVAVPLVAISAFGFASLRSYRRLYEEYNHKQRVMELYASFRKEIAENGTDEQKKQLLTIMLEAVADKSYLAAAAKDDKGQGDLLAGVNGLTSLLNNLMKSRA